MADSNSQVNPALMAFLDAEEPAKQLEVLHKVSGQLDDRSLTSIEMSLGMEPQKDDIDLRIARIRNYLNTRLKYEKSRL